MQSAPLASQGRKPINPWFIAPLVALAAFMEVLDMSIANVSLRHIAGSLAASPEEATWVLTSYLVTNAIALPVAGWMSEYFGRTRFYIACIIGFSLASLACGLATSLNALIFFRALQGLAGGALQPVSQAILADAFPLAKRAMAFSIYGIAVVAAPAIGPTLGGWITDQYAWHWIFLINVPVGIVLIFLILRFLPLDKAPDVRAPVDYLGFGLIALGLGLLQWILDRGQHYDWFASELIVVTSAIVVIALYTYILRALKQSSPIVKFDLYRNRNYAIANLMMFVLGFVLLGSTAMLPLFMQSLMGYTALDAGLVMTPGGLIIMALMPVVGKLAGRLDPRVMITFGLVCSASALWHLSGVTLEFAHNQLAHARMWQAAGLAFLFIPINMMAYATLSPDSNNQASSMLALMRNLGGGVGISVLVTLLERFSQRNQVTLIAHTSPVDPEWQERLLQLTHQLGDSQAALAVLDGRLWQQAQLLAYSEGFQLMALMFFLLVPLVWWLNPFPRPPVQG